MRYLFHKSIATLILWLGAFLSTALYGADPVDFVHGETTNFNTHASYLFDDIQPRDADEVIARYIEQDSLWIPPESRKKASLFESVFRWQKLTLRNAGDTPLALFFRHAEPTLIEGQFLLIRDDQSVEHWELGSSKPFTARPLEHRSYLIPFTLEAGEIVTLLTGYENIGVSRGTMVVGQEKFWHDSLRISVGDGMYFGTALLLASLVLLMYLGSRQTIYLYCFFIILGNLTYQVARGGYAHKYLWPQWPGGQGEVVMISLNFATIAAILFTLSFLKLKTEDQRWLYHLSNIVIGWNLVLAGMIVILPPDAVTAWVVINIFICIIYYLIVWVYSITRGLQGHSRAGFYSIAWLAYFLPNLIATAYFMAEPDKTAPIWAMSRNGELLFTIVLYVALLLEFRRAQISSRASRLESRTKNRFLTAISHELRTPLNGVLGSAELLQTTELSPTQKHYTDIINSSGNTLLHLINDTLDLAKFNEQELVLEKIPFRLDRLLAECSATFLPEMNKKRLPLYITIEPELPLHFLGDEHRLRQVLFNLLSNAMKFTERGSINVAVGAGKTVGPTTDIIIKVRDTGIGISESSLSKIFEPFSQAEASTSRQFGGSGLGLSISKRILEHMRGSLSVTSVVDEGSEFTVALCLDVDTDRESRRQEALQGLAGMRILFLTDAQGAVDALSPNIHLWGVELDVAKDFQSARSRLHSKDYDALLAFFTMPQANLLENLHSLDIDTILMHHTNVTPPTEDWTRQLIDLPVPAGTQDIANCLIRLYQSSATQHPAASIPEKGADTSDRPLILIAEDDTTNQMVAVGMLEHLGFKADTANNGQEACEMTLHKRYDLVLMDCDMPVMDGYSASREILSQEQKPPLIAALTADAQDSNEDRCKDSGMSHILHKPLSMQELRAYLQSLGFIDQGDQ